MNFISWNYAQWKIDEYYQLLWLATSKSVNFETYRSTWFPGVEWKNVFTIGDYEMLKLR